MNLSDRRFRPRFPYHARGILILLPQLVDVTIIDISLSGAHVVLDRACDIQMGQDCALRIVNHEGRQLIEVEGSPVHRSANGHIGLALRNVTSGMEQALRTIVEMNLGTESLLTRELCALLHPLRSRDSCSS